MSEQNNLEYPPLPSWVGEDLAQSYDPAKDILTAEYKQWYLEARDNYQRELCDAAIEYDKIRVDIAKQRKADVHDLILKAMRAGLDTSLIVPRDDDSEQERE